MPANIEFGNDVEQALVRAMFANRTLRQLVSGQIYPSHLSELDQEFIEFPCVTFRQAGGSVQDWQETVYSQTYQVWVWSKESYNEAMNVRDAVRLAINNKRLKSGNSVVYSKVSNLGQNVFDPTASLYYTTAQYKVYTIDVSGP